MRIKKVFIKNFRSIKELEFVFPDRGILNLVGANNAGKSNMLRAINALLGDDWFSLEKLEDYDYYCRNRNNTIDIKIEFDNGSIVHFDGRTPYSKYYDGNRRSIFPNSLVKEDFPCTYLAADRSLSKHLEFKSWALMGKISKSFHKMMDGKKEAIEHKFNEIMNIFDSVPNFVDFKKDFIKFFENMQADSPYQMKIDFKPFTPTNYFKNINILAFDPGLPSNFIDLDELGEGCRNIVLLSLLRSYAKNFKNQAQGILAIEEPEIYMHPQAQRHLYNIFWEIVSESNIQIIITTHSSTFVRTENFDTVAKIYKECDQDKQLNTKMKMLPKHELLDFCKNTGVPERKLGNSIFDFYSTTSNFRLNEGFFAKYLILVEGETEELALPEYLRLLDIDCDLLGISIIAVNGKNQIPKYWRLFSSFNIPILIIFDNDNTNDKQISNQNLCNCFDCSMDDIVNGVDIFKIINVNKTTDDGLDVFNQKILILEVDFETAIKNNWLKNNGNTDEIDRYEKEAKEFIKPLPGQGKGQIARYVARKLVKHNNFVPCFVSAISEELKDIKTEILEEEQCNEEVFDDELPFISNPNAQEDDDFLPF